MIRTSLELERDHNFLVKQKMDMLRSNGIFSSRDDAYEKLPANLQKKYLNIQSCLDQVHNEMIRKLLNEPQLT